MNITTTNYLELIAKLDEYIMFLDKANEAPTCSAYIHGWRCPENDIKKGEELRKEISKLRAMIN